MCAGVQDGAPEATMFRRKFRAMVSGNCQFGHGQWWMVWTDRVSPRRRPGLAAPVRMGGVSRRGKMQGGSVFWPWLII